MSRTDAEHHAHEHHHDTHSKTGPGNTMKTGEEKPFIDPVCGMRVGANPEQEITYKSMVYHF